MRSFHAPLAALALASCASLPEDAPVDSAASGALAIFPLLDEEAGPDKNVVYSPASIDQAFGLLRLGAAGETAAQLDAILPAPRNADYLRFDNQDVTVRLANALFLSRDFAFRDAFVNEAKRRYDANTQSVDFAQSQPAANTINAWAKKETEGLIDSVITPTAITDFMIAVLANALYFDAKWDEKLTRGGEVNFLFGDGTDTPFKFVGLIAPYSMVDARGWKAARLPYRHPRYAMDIVMPSKRRVMDAAPAIDWIEELGRMLGAAEPRLTDLLIPQFQVDYATGLVAPLQALGLTEPFDKQRANLALIGASGARNLFVSDARHVTKLQVFDEGTRAAAVTTVSVVVTGSTYYQTPPPVFHVDRPFIIVIRDLEARQILFLGRIADPQLFQPETRESSR